MKLLSFIVFAGFFAHVLAAEIDFNRDIRPILSQNCFACHGPDGEHREADLRFDTRDGATGSRDGAVAIVPGQPDEGQMMARILSTDPDEIMPPPKAHKTLTPEEIAALRQWISDGAPYDQAWAYVPPKGNPPPAVQDTTWPKNQVDHFILHRLESESLKPTPDADRRTGLRRLSFDLTGLPPSPDVLRAFEADPSKKAWEKQVNRLLNSSAFGERMAMFWLDLVRYADTVGYHGDQDHNISPYRDYVIDAFNDNLRFDQFTREQLAGDLLPNPTLDQKIASGYNRLLQTSHEGGVQPKEYLAIYAADRIRNVSGVWMGATVGCAQCHDHKYDPYTLKDFYSMVAFFADIDEAQHFKVGSNSLPTKRPPEIKVLSKRDRGRLAKIDAALAKDPENATLKTERAEWLKRERMTMISVAIQPRPIRILPRGNWLDDSGEIVQPAVPAFMGSLETEGRATRLDLADWLVDAEKGVGGLTARVFVNRLWYLFFGEGLSRSLEDFGGQGEPPKVYPELLDALAVEFIRSDWDVKHMVRLLVMSRAYQQASVANEVTMRRDPENRFFGRQMRYRLPAEMIRDNALAISGLLVDEVGGASVKPYQPAGYYRHLNFPQRKYAEHKDTRQWRRGVYVHWQRMFLHPMLKAFDAPSREECTPKRPRSNTPTAAIALLNDPTFVEAARVFAERLLQMNKANDETRLRHAFEWVTSRQPDASEKQMLLALLLAARQDGQRDPKAAEALLAVGLAPRQEGLPPGEVAAWTQVSRALLNLNECVTRN